MKAHGSRSLQRGGFLLGFVFGLLIGLAAALGVALVDLAAWLSGERIAPGEVFIAALDIVARKPRGAA